MSALFKRCLTPLIIAGIFCSSPNRQRLSGPDFDCQQNHTAHLFYHTHLHFRCLQRRSQTADRVSSIENNVCRLHHRTYSIRICVSSLLIGVSLTVHSQATAFSFQLTCLYRTGYPLFLWNSFCVFVNLVYSLSRPHTQPRSR